MCPCPHFTTPTWGHSLFSGDWRPWARDPAAVSPLAESVWSPSPVGKSQGGPPPPRASMFPRSGALLTGRNPHWFTGSLHPESPSLLESGFSTLNHSDCWSLGLRSESPAGRELPGSWEWRALCGQSQDLEETQLPRLCRGW